MRLGRQMLHNDWIRFTAEKNGEVVEIPILPQLQAEIDRAPKGMFIVTAYGRHLHLTDLEYVSGSGANKPG